MDRHELPVHVMFDNPVFSVSLRLATVRALGTSFSVDSDSPVTLQGSLKLVRQYSELFYVINHIVHGQLQQL